MQSTDAHAAPYDAQVEQRRSYADYGGRGGAAWAAAATPAQTVLLATYKAGPRRDRWPGLDM